MMPSGRSVRAASTIFTGPGGKYAVLVRLCMRISRSLIYRLSSFPPFTLLNTSSETTVSTVRMVESAAATP